jgi:hypothetical protein
MLRGVEGVEGVEEVEVDYKDTPRFQGMKSS